MIANLLLVLAMGAHGLDIEPGPRYVVLAVPKAGSHTLWRFDACRDGKLVKMFSEEDDTLPMRVDCVPHGGEVYSTRVANVEVLDGPINLRIRRVGLIGHALLLRSSNERQQLMVLAPAPQRLREATGLEYIAIDRGSISEWACTNQALEENTGDTQDAEIGLHGEYEHCYRVDSLRQHFRTPEPEEDKAP